MARAHRASPFVVINDSLMTSGASMERPGSRAGKHSQRVHQHKGKLSGGAKKPPHFRRVAPHEREMPEPYTYVTTVQHIDGHGPIVKGLKVGPRGFEPGDRVKVTVEIMPPVEEPEAEAPAVEVSEPEAPAAEAPAIETKTEPPTFAELIAMTGIERNELARQLGISGNKFFMYSRHNNPPADVLSHVLKLATKEITTSGDE